MLYHRDLVLPTEKYYVYIHRNPLTHKIFYVGSAKGNPLRAYEFGKHRNQSWKNEVISFGGTCNIIVEIVQYCEDPIQAQEAEFRLIYKLKKCGEAYCCNEGDTSFKRKYPKLQYHLFIGSTHIKFTRKMELFSYCKEKYGLSRNIVNLLIENDGEYNGSHQRACGLSEIAATRNKNQFDAYVKAGFTEDQAIAFILNDNLQLVKNMEKLSSNSSAKVNAK